MNHCVLCAGPVEDHPNEVPPADHPPAGFDSASCAATPVSLGASSSQLQPAPPADCIIKSRQRVAAAGLARPASRRLNSDEFAADREGVCRLHVECDTASCPNHVPHYPALPLSPLPPTPLASGSSPPPAAAPNTSPTHPPALPRDPVDHNALCAPPDVAAVMKTSHDSVVASGMATTDDAQQATRASCHRSRHVGHGRSRKSRWQQDAEDQTAADHDASHDLLDPHEQHHHPSHAAVPESTLPHTAFASAATLAAAVTAPVEHDSQANTAAAAAGPSAAPLHLPRDEEVAHRVSTRVLQPQGGVEEYQAPPLDMSLLPVELLQLILAALDVRDLCALALVCRSWRRTLTDSRLFFALYRERYPVSPQCRRRDHHQHQWRCIYLARRSNEARIASQRSRRLFLARTPPDWSHLPPPRRFLPCDQRPACDLTFDSFSALHVHLRHHLTHVAQHDRPHVCAHCSRSFMVPGRLHRHILRTHQPHTSPPLLLFPEQEQDAMRAAADDATQPEDGSKHDVRAPTARPVAESPTPESRRRRSPRLKRNASVALAPATEGSNGDGGNDSKSLVSDSDPEYASSSTAPPRPKRRTASRSGRIGSGGETLGWGSGAKNGTARFEKRCMTIDGEERKAFVCLEESCGGKVFFSDSGFRKHRASQHGGQLHPCLVPGCTRSFTRPSDLRRHDTRAHAPAHKHLVCTALVYTLHYGVFRCGKRFDTPSAFAIHIHGPQMHTPSGAQEPQQQTVMWHVCGCRLVPPAGMSAGDFSLLQSVPVTAAELLAACDGYTAPNAASTSAEVPQVPFLSSVRGICTKRFRSDKAARQHRQRHGLLSDFPFPHVAHPDDDQHLDPQSSSQHAPPPPI